MDGIGYGLPAAELGDRNGLIMVLILTRIKIRLIKLNDIYQVNYATETG